MQSNTTPSVISMLVDSQFQSEERSWLDARITQILTERTASSLFIQYSRLSEKFRDLKPKEGETPLSDTKKNKRKITPLELARIYLLGEVIKGDAEFFIPKVQQLIQVADKEELRTFLAYLTLLPEPEQFKTVAVEALRTNISTVFDAIALNNPYPAMFFDDSQWNQMFLKAAFMERPLHQIAELDRRANAPLARIISDYAHERWAASRDVNPYIWRPTAAFLDGDLLVDMEHLLNSDSEKEQIAGALCLGVSPLAEARKLLAKYAAMDEKVKNNGLNWAQVIS